MSTSLPMLVMVLLAMPWLVGSARKAKLPVTTSFLTGMRDETGCKGMNDSSSVPPLLSI